MYVQYVEHNDYNEFSFMKYPGCEAVITVNPPQKAEMSDTNCNTWQGRRDRAAADIAMKAIQKELLRYGGEWCSNPEKVDDVYPVIREASRTALAKSGFRLPEEGCRRYGISLVDNTIYIFCRMMNGYSFVLGYEERSC